MASSAAVEFAQLIRTLSRRMSDENILSSSPVFGDDSSSVVPPLTAVSSFESSSSLSSSSSIKSRWQAMTLHRFLAPKTYARESTPLSQTKLHDLLRTMPSATTTVDRCLRTPLHLACANRFVTPAMISMLLAATGGKDALVMQDVEGCTPLHYSCQHHPDADIISLLVEANPDITAIPDNDSMTPLHHACAHLTSISSPNVMPISAPTVAILLRTDPSIALARDRNGNTPFALVCQEFDMICRHGFSRTTGRPKATTFGSFLLLERALPIFKAISVYSSGGRQAQNIDLDVTWDNMLHCALTAAKMQAAEREVFSRTRLTCEFAVLAIIHWCKDQALTLDSRKNTPLHIAASLPASSVPVGSRLLYPIPDKCIGRDKCIVNYLVRICPEAAHKRNEDGRLPLQNIVEAPGSSWKYGIRALVGANPEAVAELDIDSRLYPNILSRAGSDVGLSSVFSILKESPDLMSVGSGYRGGRKTPRLRVRRKRLR